MQNTQKNIIWIFWIFFNKSKWDILDTNGLPSPQGVPKRWANNYNKVSKRRNKWSKYFHKKGGFELWPVKIFPDKMFLQIIIHD